MTDANAIASTESSPAFKLPESAIGFPHTVTFYSFKGGVGRTLALLNVAVLLARRGNRVAIADFDLEAPGIDSYPGFGPPTPDQPGLLEFIGDYLAAPKTIPSIRPYLYEHKIENAEGDGTIFVIRAGRQGEAYRRNLMKLDWDALFARHDGHTLFANLKAELFDDFGGNFLLLDSRTGLTDVAGVCTGLLPDAVIFMFYPDEQNRRGIETVAKAIKRHAEYEGRRIDRMYCVSRVPDIDERRTAAQDVVRTLHRDVEVFEFPLRLVSFAFGETCERTWIDARWPLPETAWDWSSYSDIAAPRVIYGHLEFGHRYPMAGIDMSGTMVWQYNEPEGPQWLVGGLAMTQILEQRRLKDVIIAEINPDDRDCLPYWQLATFAAVANHYERQKLIGVARKIHPKQGDDEFHRPSDTNGPLPKWYRDQVAYLRRWHMRRP